MKIKEVIVGPTPPEGTDTWWRADDKRYANYDPFAEFEQPSGSSLKIELTPFEMVKETPRGVWVRNWLGSKFFVLGEAARQIAVPTKQLAIQDLVRRKEKHVRMSEMRAKMAREHLAAAVKCLEAIK